MKGNISASCRTVTIFSFVKLKVIPQQAELAQGIPGRLRSWIFLTFCTTRVVVRQPYTPVAFTPGEIPGTHFQRLSRPKGTWFLRVGATENIPSDTTGNRFRDRPTSSAVHMCTYILIKNDYMIREIFDISESFIN